MKLKDFTFHLPEKLIAKHPAQNRRDSKLLSLNGETGQLEHLQFYNIIEKVQPGDLLVFNNTKVFPARLEARKETGGNVEILIEHIVDKNVAHCFCKASKSPKIGSLLALSNDAKVKVIDRAGQLFVLQLMHDGMDWMTLAQQLGQVPLPPYMERKATTDDVERYQTVYANDDKSGSVAAPTAGLHFDVELLEELEQKGIQTAFVTLHVGAGTFQPVRVENIQDHQMHYETIEVSQDVCHKVTEAKKSGGRVIAVGTTTVRCLETAWSTEGDVVEPFVGDTNIFIYPGRPFRCVDALITNFHLPESSLIMLVSAFAGLKNTLNAYKIAIEENYRFYSYGDAMFITRNNKNETEE